MRNYLLIVIMFSCSAIYADNQKTWSNWLGNATCAICEYEEPSTLEELQDHITDAASRHLPLKVVGKGYSRNDIACTEGKLLNLKHFNHILSVDDENHFVQVEAGITLEELNEQLFTYGLTLANQPAMAKMSLAGALCTAVHGTGHTGTLASLIKEIKLITADGILRTLSSNSDSEAFAAAKVSLGTLGIIYNGVEIKDIVVRFVEADKNTYLSPASEAVAYIAIGSPCGHQYIAFYRELEDILFQYQGKPHWGKILFLDHEKAAMLYGINLQKFIQVKQRLDPRGIFSNPFTDKILKNKS